MRHLITLADVTASEIETIFAITEDLKTKLAQGIREPLLPSRMLAMLFEKQSLRTRVSFETGMVQLGGAAMYLGDEVGFGKRESMADFGGVISEYVDVVVMRTKSHQTVVDMAANCTIPVINGLTDFSHPCQALADIYTIRETFGDLKGRTVAWVGDANNVARSLILACGRVGMKVTMATPEKYRFSDEEIAWLHENTDDLSLEVFDDPKEAVADACAIYTDVWASMGQESERAVRIADFTPYQVNESLMAAAPEGCIFLHCLPARRGEEVTDAVIDSPASRVIQQAGNRMHAQKGVLAWLLGSKGDE